MAETVFPGNLTESLRRIAQAVAKSDFRDGYETAEAALAQGAVHPTLFNAKALWLERTGRDEDALAEFEQALSLSPQDVTILNAVGMCLLRLKRPTDAAMAFEEAIQSDPNHAPSHYRRGLALAAAGDHQGAERAHERAVALAPRNADALANLASILARKGEGARAVSLAHRALSIRPSQPTASYALALVDLAEARFADAESRLKTLAESKELNPQARAAIVGAIGDALDGQKRYPEAFETYIRQKAMLQEQKGTGTAPNALRVRELVQRLEASPRQPARPSEESEAATPREHVFLLGFPRSGTTLLEQVLASSPQIATLDEKDTLRGFEPESLSLTDIDADNDKLLNWRERYWQRVRSCGIALNQETILLDKDPIATMKLPLIVRLFPRAKILFAVRDPRDVVFSCFRHLFRVQVLMPEFLTLEGTAELYSNVMRLAELCREKLTFPWFDCRYESFVKEFEPSAEALCKFIGLEYSPAMANFDKAAPQIDLRSPSALQVRKPLYETGIDQWRNYREQMAPVLSTLRPWIEKFGYEPE